MSDAQKERIHVGQHMLAHGVVLGGLIGGFEVLGLAMESELLDGASSRYGFLPLILVVALIVAMPVVWCVALSAVQSLVLGMGARVERAGERVKVWRGAGVMVALVWGALWHATMMQGDGIRAHGAFAWIYAGSLVVVEVALVVCTIVGYRMTQRVALCYFTAALGMWAFSMSMLPLYSEFHFFSVVYGVWLAGKALWFLWAPDDSRRAYRMMGIAGVVCAAMTALLVWAAVSHPKHLKVLTYDLMLSKVMVKHGPLSLFQDQVDFGFEPLSPEARARAMERVDARVVTGEEYREEGRPVARHVVIIVLESMRAESWRDPEVAPHFARWKARGTYFPRAIAQYPATPLAYGAMFMSQTPQVLVRSPYWARRTLIDHLKEEGLFEQPFLSVPNNPWFTQTTITDFILDTSTSLRTHENTAQGLDALRERLSSVKDERFFGWMHVYDAHAPYKLDREAREPKPGEDKVVSSYLSEVSRVDRELGRFMTWFYEQPLAEETLLVVIGDHGEGMGDRVFGRTFWGHHAQVHRSVAEIPLYISGPGVARGRVIEGSVAGQIDVMPTLFSAIGEPLPSYFQAQGRSLFDVSGEHVEAQDQYPPQRYSVEAFSIRGQEFFDFVARTASREQVMSKEEPMRELTSSGQGYNPKVSVQKGEYKLIYNCVTQMYYLYDLVKDPEELTDLSETHPRELEQMRRELEQWREEQQVIIERFNAAPGE